MNTPYGISVDPDMAAQRANALLESEIKARIGAVRELAQRMNALDAAILEYEVAWQAAKQAGWSDDRLREIGLHSPDETAPVTGRRAAPGSTPRPHPPQHPYPQRLRSPLWCSSRRRPRPSLPSLLSRPSRPSPSAADPVLTTEAAAPSPGPRLPLRLADDPAAYACRHAAPPAVVPR
ncbi:hypothetical protein [Diaminobutyricibacter sp. McL0608]|uniref:hypothetical protein n=1 Tax=Leifsonia sp. McL0608 TaxID=3143537 RepID=UPI0031F2EBC4